MSLWMLVFFFKQKTAYEMRISDWSSDVCSSDLPTGSAQYHVNAAIAYAVEIYVAATGDRSILEDGAAEMLFETARLWMDTGHFCERRGGAFLIHGVTGRSDERRVGKEGVSTCWYRWSQSH